MSQTSSNFLEADIPVRPWHEGEAADLQTVIHLRIHNVHLAVAEIGHFCAVLKETDPGVADLQFQFIAHFAQQDHPVHEADVLADFFKFRIRPRRDSSNVCAELVELNREAVLRLLNGGADFGHKRIRFVLQIGSFSHLCCDVLCTLDKGCFHVLFKVVDDFA